MATTREKVAALLPLVERMHRGHCWKKINGIPKRIDEPLDDFKIAEHVAGRQVYGACPIAPGQSTCRVACLDLDSHKGEVPWDVMLGHSRAICETLREWFGLSPISFRSSGGRGIHIYLLWGEPQDAYSVRELLKVAIGDEYGHGFKPGAGGVAKGEIEIFPKQDSVPVDGYGSMFILPGSGKSELIE